MPQIENVVCGRWRGVLDKGAGRITIGIPCDPGSTMTAAELRIAAQDLIKLADYVESSYEWHGVPDGAVSFRRKQKQRAPSGPFPEGY